jgi:hypothetical protein
MKKQFETLTEIHTKDLFDVVHFYAEAVLREATDTGALDEQGADNEYTQELGRVLGLLGDYENKYVIFDCISFKNAVHQPKKKTPPEQQPKPRKEAAKDALTYA